MDEARDMSALDMAKIKTYAENASRIGSAVQALKGSDGWQIFLALYTRRKKEIEQRRDYDDLVEFKGDRKALDIVDDLISELETFIADAAEATKTLVGITEDGENTSRGIMLIEAMEDSNKEA